MAVLSQSLATAACRKYRQEGQKADLENTAPRLLPFQFQQERQKSSCFVFQISLIVFLKRIFPDFSIPVIIFQTSQGLQNFNFKFHDYLNFSKICKNAV